MWELICEKQEHVRDSLVCEIRELVREKAGYYGQNLSDWQTIIRINVSFVRIDESRCKRLRGYVLTR